MTSNPVGGTGAGASGTVATGLNEILLHAYEDALSLIRANRVAVERIADALVSRGVLSGPEAEALMACDTARVAPIDERQ